MGIDDKTIAFNGDPRPEPPLFGEESRAPMANGHAPNPKPPRPLAGVIDHLAWPESEPPVRQWIVDGIIPAGTVTLLQGDGGLGKSLLALMLMFSTAIGSQWLGQKTKRCRSFGFFCEDEDIEIQRRMWAILCNYRENNSDEELKGFADLDDMMLVSRVGLDSILMDFEQAEGGRGKSTAVLNQVEKAAKDHGAELIILDSLHDLFGGNENNRVQVRQFVNALQRIAIEQQCAIIINGHPSMAGLNSSSGTSGSTAWNNSVRSRLYLTREPRDKDEKPPFTGPLKLKIMKANYAAVGTFIELEWVRGVMVPKNLPGLGETSRDRKSIIRRAFLACIELAYSQNRPPQYSHTSQNFGPRLFEGMPCSQGFRKTDFKSVMEEMINDGVIAVEEKWGTNRNKIQVIIATGLRPHKPSHWESIEDPSE